MDRDDKILALHENLSTGATMVANDDLTSVHGARVNAMKKKMSPCQSVDSVREERIAELRNQFRTHAYEIETAAVGEKLIREHTVDSRDS